MASMQRIHAMKEAGVGIAAVHIDKKFIVFDNGIKLKIRLFNKDGERVEEPEDADHYEFGNEGFGYGSAHFELCEFEEWSH
jgi:hypothetical protein